MSTHEYLTNDAAEASVRALNTIVGDDVEDLVDPQIAITAVHVPGTPLERAADRDSSIAANAEAKAVRVDTRSHAAALDKEYAGIDTRTPEANLASRSNIVRD